MKFIGLVVLFGLIVVGVVRMYCLLLFEIMKFLLNMNLGVEFMVIMLMDLFVMVLGCILSCVLMWFKMYGCVVGFVRLLMVLMWVCFISVMVVILVLRMLLIIELGMFVVYFGCVFVICVIMFV